MNANETDAKGPALRWGVIGAARIARKMVPAMREAGGEVVSIAASSKARAEAFAREHDIERAYEGYQNLLDDPDVEAVYLALVNSLHLEWAIKTARAGKPLLCEKPMVMSAADARELHRMFGQAHCRLQEGFMWRHHPQVAWLRRQFDDGFLGELRRVNATFNFNLHRDEDYRWNAAMGGGALWDIGCYCVNAARYFFAAEPIAGSARGHFVNAESGADQDAAAWLDFGRGRMAALTCSFRAAYAQGIELLGSQGRVYMERPWTTRGRRVRILLEHDEKQTVKEFEPSNPFASMAAHFSRAVHDPSYALLPGEDGLAQAVAMEGLAESLSRGGEVWTARND